MHKSTRHFISGPTMEKIVFFEAKTFSCSNNSLMGTVVNETSHYVNGGSFEIREQIV